MSDDWKTRQWTTSELWGLSGGNRGDYQSCSVLYCVPRKSDIEASLVMMETARETCVVVYVSEAVFARAVHGIGVAEWKFAFKLLEIGLSAPLSQGSVMFFYGVADQTSCRQWLIHLLTALLRKTRVVLINRSTCKTTTCQCAATPRMVSQQVMFSQHINIRFWLWGWHMAEVNQLMTAVCDAVIDIATGGCHGRDPLRSPA